MDGAKKVDEECTNRADEMLEPSFQQERCVCGKSGGMDHFKQE